MTWFETVPLDSLEPEAGLCVIIDGERIALLRTIEGVRAIGDRCSHAEASLSEGEIFDGEVECPRHGATFDIETGEALTLPAVRPVPTYGVRVTNGMVEVEVAR